MHNHIVTETRYRPLKVGSSEEFWTMGEKPDSATLIRVMKAEEAVKLLFAARLWHNAVDKQVPAKSCASSRGKTGGASVTLRDWA